MRGSSTTLSRGQDNAGGGVVLGTGWRFLRFPGATQARLKDRVGPKRHSLIMETAVASSTSRARMAGVVISYGLYHVKSCEI